MKEIKNITIYDKENVKKFLEIYFFERIKTIRLILNIFIIITVVSFFINEDKSTVDIITLICALLGFIEINTSVLPYMNYYKLTKRKDSILNTHVTYLFKKNNFELNKNEYIDYDKLNKVIETDYAYYLYINSSRALIVDKKVLSDKEITTLTNIFKEKVSTYKYKSVR